MTFQPQTSDTDYNSKIIDFIGDIMNHLEMDKMIFKENVATDEKQKLYETFVKGNPLDILQKLRVDTSKAFIGVAMKEYFKQLNVRSAQPIQLAVSSNDAKLLVWAEIKDDDEKTENALIMSEAFVNSIISKYGFYFVTTIVEQSDNTSIPPHYHTFLMNKMVDK